MDDDNCMRVERNEFSGTRLRILVYGGYRYCLVQNLDLFTNN